MTELTRDQLSRLRFATLGEMDDAYRRGHVSQAEYEAFRHAWATSTFRWTTLEPGSNGYGWTDHPTEPEVVAILEALDAEGIRCCHPMYERVTR